MGVFAMLSCGAGGVRPFFQPLPGASSDTVLGAPDAVIRSLRQLVLAEGVEVRHASEVEGYLESTWFDIADQTSTGDPGTNTHTRVRMRFWADSFAEGRTIVIGEVVRRRVVDPSLPERELETLVDQEHPGHAIAARILSALQARLTAGGAN